MGTYSSITTCANIFLNEIQWKLSNCKLCKLGSGTNILHSSNFFTRCRRSSSYAAWSRHEGRLPAQEERRLWSLDNLWFLELLKAIKWYFCHLLLERKEKVIRPSTLRTSAEFIRKLSTYITFLQYIWLGFLYTCKKLIFRFPFKNCFTTSRCIPYT